MPSYDVGGFLGWYIHLGIDWGARYLKLAWQIIPSGGDISDPALAPEPLYLPGYSESQDGIAQVMIDAGDGNGAHDGGNGVRGLYFGNAAVDKYLEQNPNCSHHTISSLKLMLHSDYQYREEVKAIRKAMECDVINFPGVEYLVGRHFAAIIQAAISRLRLIDKGQLGTESRPDLTTLPVEAQVAVPVMWDADARGVMQSGARRGGCSRTNIREESHANASTLVDDLQKAGIKCGDAFLLIDIGAATLDLSMMCFTKEGRLSLESLSSGRLPDPNQLASHLRRTGDSSGSSKLNADAYHHFTQEDAGGPLYGANLDEVCAAMNISENERHDQFSRQFVALKLESRDCNPVSFIHIEDASKKLQFAAITGGGSKSLLLCDRIHALLAAHKMNSIEWDPNKHSCCRGLLMNYNFETSRLPEHANFYLTGPMDNLPAGVDVDDIAASARVNGRTLTCLGVYDQHHEFNFSAREPVPRAFNMPISGDSSGLLHLEIWMNEALGALPDDTPLIQDGKLPRGFSKLAVTFVDVPDLHGRGFTRNKATGRPCFKVHGTIRLEKREESLYVVVTLFKARHSCLRKCFGRSKRKYGNQVGVH
ncbi:hypothetical protein B0A48_06687 [Cryoendolithus antarcticus]|uniref:Uncharacterized protein n=1 Tax=Cryoendolithus antarcticus TaxID=1507870 RepID=A0A1V8T925_9PEZI|nr:hypothetical protein B0A48_06687 [Cryoendolithus antarcticus]